MFIKTLRLILTTTLFTSIILASLPAAAQDKGPPAMRTLTFYTIAGAGGGAFPEGNRHGGRSGSPDAG